MGLITKIRFYEVQSSFIASTSVHNWPPTHHFMR